MLNASSTPLTSPEGSPPARRASSSKARSSTTELDDYDLIQTGDYEISPMYQSNLAYYGTGPHAVVNYVRERLPELWSSSVDMGSNILNTTIQASCSAYTWTKNVIELETNLKQQQLLEKESQELANTVQTLKNEIESEKQRLELERQKFLAVQREHESRRKIAENQSEKLLQQRANIELSEKKLKEKDEELQRQRADLSALDDKHKQSMEETKQICEQLAQVRQEKEEIERRERQLAEEREAEAVRVRKECDRLQKEKEELRLREEQLREQKQAEAQELHDKLAAMDLERERLSEEQSRLKREKDQETQEMRQRLQALEEAKQALEAEEQPLREQRELERQGLLEQLDVMRREKEAMEARERVLREQQSELPSPKAVAVDSPSSGGRLRGEAPSRDTKLQEECECMMCSLPLVRACTLTCSHTFCEACIENWARQSKHTPLCPKCRVPIKAAPVRTRVLDGIVALAVQSLDQAEYDEWREKCEDADAAGPSRFRWDDVVARD